MTRVHPGATHHGWRGTALHVMPMPEQHGPRPWPAAVSTWFLDCPGQAPWRHYLLSVVHLRAVEGAPPAVVTVPGSTHEVLLLALDPDAKPKPLVVDTWRRLTPMNVVEQVQLPDDVAATTLAGLAARAVVVGALWAEPPLAGAREPWRTVLSRTSAHLRGQQPHAC